MRRFRLLATSLMVVALCTGFSSCGDDVTNEIIQEVQEPDNTLELLIGTWEEQGKLLDDFLNSMKIIHIVMTHLIVMKLKMVHLNTSYRYMFVHLLYE
ncbi:MAG: hypothetical protein ACLUVG_06460 [Phocaeicola vulgatus]